MKNYLLTLTIAGSVLLGALPGFADAPVKKVNGVYTYYGDKNDSPAMAKRKALEGARLDAISKEFGTIVSQDLLQADRAGANGETSKFFSLSATEVKGEWIADDGQPSYTVSLDADDNLVVSCRISGQAKGITNEAIDFEALALRNGQTKGNASTEYYDGDNLYLHVSAPVDGALGVFLLDEEGNVILMLPYSQDPRQEALLKKNYDYTFFDETKPLGNFGEVDGFNIAANGEDVEFNKMYVVFSPNKFSLPSTRTTPEGLRMTKEEDFTKWLVKSRRNDPKMAVKQINLKILPRH